MLKMIRCLLYGLATLAGVSGLVISGVPLVKYGLERLHDYESTSYYDTTYLHAPEIIFLLSLMLLVFVNIGLVIERRLGSVSVSNPVMPGKTTPDPSAPVSETVSGSSAVPANPDSKLAHLLNPKKD